MKFINYILAPLMTLGIAGIALYWKGLNSSNSLMTLEALFFIFIGVVSFMLYLDGVYDG